jgi:hypothetical protein
MMLPLQMPILHLLPLLPNYRLPLLPLPLILHLLPLLPNYRLQLPQLQLIRHLLKPMQQKMRTLVQMVRSLLSLL